MNVLIFEWKNFGIEDICSALTKLGHTYKCISNELMRERVSAEFDELFDREFSAAAYDCVFTFNYSPIISNNCNKRNIPYIAYVYDSPLVALYSYTIINPCNYVFIFDSTLYLELKKEHINTVYYAPLAANVERLTAQLNSSGNNNKNADSKCSLQNNSSKNLNSKNDYSETTCNTSNSKNDRQNIALNTHDYICDVSFVGSMYNEKHNLFDRFKDLPDFTRGYIDAIMQSQLKVYGYYFIEELLNSSIIETLQKSVPVSPNKDGVETVSYLYSYYFIARKLAALERKDLLNAVSERFDTKLYTPNPTPELSHITNMGPVDYYNDMPYVFAKSRINLNITLRSIRSGIPLRAIDILGAGGFLLSNYQADFFEFFTPNQDLALFESKEDLLNKCDYYLKHDKERCQIAANGHGIVKEKHTYEVRLQEIFDIVFN